MKIILPKTSGFCYGVCLAVKEAEKIISSGKKLVMYGEIVHNPDVVSDLESKGAITVESAEELTARDLDEDFVLLIRAHGVPRAVEDKLGQICPNLVDKTCPKVKKVHLTVCEEEEKGRRIIIIGNPQHPEVIGILGQCKSGACVVSTPEEAR
ncbi:MAG: bifunctional 4-hydroxy-3-methylbut-2-enyl diphosphate reductase/30S ribosomal protein S1, partial [Clostridia bacterium]|nr:bifunctional 4-hydroxy-3-methylbut-2-enyl diphosphate reductase/30S ribosomal protein S1 [Clostridia bacterium]